ncbi:hypothetical protein [Streptococcus hyointestinalis]|uniref:hypothetical protein n=1 Tax=Streptococcus hyointestinalis TaxID=1337 RepID=UPI003216AA1D
MPPVRNTPDQVALSAEDGDYTVGVLLSATPRVPHIEGMGLENTNIAFTERRAIQVEDYCETSVPPVYAGGEDNGGLHYPYTSLGDFRSVYGRRTGNCGYLLSKRQNVPNTTFSEPALFSVGSKDAELVAKGIAYKTNEV